MKKTLLFSIFALAALSLTAQSTRSFTAGKANDYGLIYSLPFTEIDITVETEHVATTPGEFYNYARHHLAINDAITSATNTVAVKSVTITTRGVADPNNRWQVTFKSGSTTSMLLDADGRPLAINTDNLPEEEVVTLPVAVPAEPTILQSDAARQAMTQEMIRSTSTTKRAELAAQRIFELREMRSDILSGQADNVPSDGEGMRLVLDNIDKQEQALTAMFAGTTQRWTSVQTFTLRVDTLGLEEEVFARISPVDGILDADNLAGAPLTVTVKTISRGEIPTNEKGEVKTFPKGGVAYTIPGRAEVVISFEGNTIATASVELAQLGITFGLDPSLFSDKKAPMMLLFDPATGSVRDLSPVQ